MCPFHSLRTHAKWHHPCYERVEEGNIEDFEEKVDGERLGPRELPASWLVTHDQIGRDVDKISVARRECRRKEEESTEVAFFSDGWNMRRQLLETDLLDVSSKGAPRRGPVRSASC